MDIASLALSQLSKIFIIVGIIAAIGFGIVYYYNHYKW
jgi:hypothetical protein